jgi:hypothetical protein
VSSWRHLRRPWGDYQDAGRKCEVPALVMWLAANASALGLLGPTGGIDHYKTLRARVRRATAVLPPLPRRFWRALAVLGVLYMGALYLNHQAHACVVLRGYSVYQDDTGYHLCKVRPWYWFW